MSGHTSAPWTIKEDPGRRFSNGDIDYGGFRIDAPDIEQLAYVWRSNVRWGSSKPFGAAEAEANAKLIAAAPDLLKACKRAFDQTDRVARPNDWELLRAAIAKATGEA